MKRIITVLAVAALMAVMLVAPGVAGAKEEPNNIPKQCKDGSLLGSGQGGCVAFWETPIDNRNTTANVATSCQEQDYREFIGSIPDTNPGQCVKAQGKLSG